MEERRSRLHALTKMGVVPNYTDIHNKRVVVVGLGGIGSVAAEMLVRCGIGHLVIFDYDTVEMANMNRMFYKPSHVGLPKVEAAMKSLKEIIGDDDQVELHGHNVNITTVDGFPILRSQVRCADITLCCVDNYSARIAVNRVCLEEDRPWIESGVSETAMSGHIQLMIPGSSACFECAPPLGVNSDEKIKRDLVCTASLPTTMSIIAGLGVQACLKFLLRFGNAETAGCLSYQARTDYFSSYIMRPNPDCSSELCRNAQGRVVDVANEKIAESTQPEAEHENNDWGIEVVTIEASHDNPIDSSDQDPLLSMSVGDLMTRLKNR